MKKGLSELVFILDRSGSMGGLERDTIGGFNSMLTKQKKETGEANVTTVLFDDQVEVIHDRFPLAAVKPLTDEDYFVRGSTALLDAIGSTVKKIENVQKRLPEELQAENVIFVITTDGYENSSSEYTVKMVKSLIEAHQEQGWQFIFMGANIDAVTEAGKIGIGKNRAVSYRNDSEGVALNYAATSHVLSEMRVGSLSKEVLDDEIDKAFEPIRRHLKK
jgi:uncharacterized protein YegL